MQPVSGIHTSPPSVAALPTHCFLWIGLHRLCTLLSSSSASSIRGIPLRTLTWPTWPAAEPLIVCSVQAVGALSQVSGEL